MDGLPVSVAAEWLANRLSIGNTEKPDSHFISVKQEMDFVADSLCNQSSFVRKAKKNESCGRASCSNSQGTVTSGTARPIDEASNRTREEETKNNRSCDTAAIRTARRGQIDLLDMRKKQISDYKFIFMYEDQSSKFVILKPLRRDDVQDVASELLDAFMILGPPRILQSNNGRNFAKGIVFELRKMWEDLVIVHGDVCTNVRTTSARDLNKLLGSWLTKHPGKTWWEGLRFVQMLENNSSHCENNKTPYEILFGRNPHEEDSATSLPLSKEVLDTVWSEEDFVRITDKSRMNPPTSLKLFCNDYDPKEVHGDEPENHTVKEDACEDSPDVEFDGETDKSPMSDTSGFKFVSVKSEASPNTVQVEDSQSDDESTNTTTEIVGGKLGDKYQFRCKICQKQYMKLGHLKNHIKAHGKATSYDCKICLKKFRLPNVHEKHMRRYHKHDKILDELSYGHVERVGNERSSSRKPLKKQLDQVTRSSGRRVSPKDVDSRDKSSSFPVAKDRQRAVPRRKTSTKESRATKLTRDTLLECNYCQQKFDFPSVLKRHVRSHTNERPYVCPVCNKSFKQLGHLSQHSLTHTDYRSFQCAVCGVKFESLDALKTHSPAHKDELFSSNTSSVIYRPREIYRLFECDTCKKVFTTKSVLERHIYTHTHERQFGCKVCGKRFKQAGHVKSHMLVHTGERKFECTVCSKRFSLSNSLKKHMYVHNGEKPYQCDVCGARFLEKRNLNGHLMTHTNERPFSCTICGKRYTLADTLRRHISAAHENGRTYQCEICAKMFKQLAHLYVHKKVHTDERPFQCHLCAKNFKHKNVLKSHLAIHANLRPFECDVCKATFVRKTNLQTHIASAHMNERPYACTICGKRFKQVSHLNGHVIVHSNSMPFQCDFCDRRCNRLDNLKKHMRLHNKNKE